MNRFFHLRKILLLVLSVALSFLYFEAYADEKPSIYFGSANLSLGMTQSKVTDLISISNLALEPIPSFKAPYASFHIQTKTKPVKAEGQIIFRENKLTFIGKNCSPDKKDAASTFKALHRILSSIMQNESAPAVIQKTIFSQPTYEVKHINLFVNGYKINISLTEDFDNREPSPYIGLYLEEE